VKILVRVSVDAVIGLVLAGVVCVGGEGLDLGDGEVDGAGGGDGRQGAVGAVWSAWCFSDWGSFSSCESIG